MKANHRDFFTTIHTEGALLPSDLLQRIAESSSDLEGRNPSDYHLAGEKINEATNRSWNRLLGIWTSFRGQAAALSPDDPGTGLTRDRWLLPLFQELGYGRLLTHKSVEIEGKTYPISHRWQHTPFHLVGFRVDLDRRMSGVAGAARTSPHSLLQEFLNRSQEHLWGFLSNGLRLRILRDNLSLTRQAYVEFDLEAMMEGEIYSDFVILWLLCHQSRVEAEKPEECWLEKWSHTAQTQGARALDQLRAGVEEAIAALGKGFLRHPANEALLQKLRSGELHRQDYYREVLRLVYRLIFLMVAEDRRLLLHPDTDPDVAARTLRFYSMARLRALAEKKRGTRHSDLYHGVRLVMEKLGSDTGCPELGLPSLGGFLFSKEALKEIGGCEISNQDFLQALRGLSFITFDGARRPVDFRNLGSEELGSIYESLLELHPELNVDAGTFDLETAGGHERKTTGSYYTPSSLVQCLLDSALDPVLDEATRKQNPEQAILNLKVCDPACGSGHFLVAAAHRMARKLAAVRTGDEEPSPEATRTALRDVIGRCLYGVDLNPMSVELCKVSLWMEALEPGKPLSFLDHHIQCGNSLLGATPGLMGGGIPDDAFKPLDGDDKKIVQALRKRNREQRTGQSGFDPLVHVATQQKALASGIQDMEVLEDGSSEAIRLKQERYTRFGASDAFRQAKLLADAWCAAFVWKKAKDAPLPVVHDVFLRLARNPGAVPMETRQEIERLAGLYRFFHWHVAFPEVFRVDERTGEVPEISHPAGWKGGFDVVLGNPPWERIKLQEKEWFASCRPDIANAPNAAARRRKIEALREEDPPLFTAFMEDRRKAEGESHLVRSSGRYPLCGRGDVNTYALFAESKRLILGPVGRVGCIVPSGIATDDTTKFFFQDLMDSRSLVSLYDFENRDAIFPGVHRSYKFSLLTLSGQDRPARTGAQFVFFAHNTEELKEPERRFTLSAEDIALLNPNTRTCPIFRSQKDAEITKAIYRRVPVLIQEGPPEVNPWGITFMRMFDMANDSHLFRTREQLEAEGWHLEGNVFHRDGEKYLPLYEAKMVHHFDHRWASYEGLETRDVTLAEKQDPAALALPRYWVPEGEVDNCLLDKWKRSWLLGWRDICRSTDERTVISGIVPKSGCGDKFLLILPSSYKTVSPIIEANLDSFALDYIARQKLGGVSLKYYTFKQLPILPPSTYQQSTPCLALPALPQPDSSHACDLSLAAESRKAFRRISAVPGSMGIPSAMEASSTSTARECRQDGHAPRIESPRESSLSPYSLPPDSLSLPSLASWLLPRVLELTYTAHDLAPFARDCGYDGPPFRWDEERRFLIRCELDAAYFHLYGISRDDADYILETFPIVKRKDEQRHGEFRTKRVILEIYDAMADSISTGNPYQTSLDPPPGPPKDGLPQWDPGMPKPPHWPSHIHPPKANSDVA
jgi:hypothetical protein